MHYAGTIESTGQTTQARSSYLPSEVLWGHRFQPMVVYNKERQGYEVDYSRFNNTDLVDTPLCSARQLEQFYQLQQELGQSNQPDRGNYHIPCVQTISVITDNLLFFSHFVQHLSLLKILQYFASRLCFCLQAKICFFKQFRHRTK